MAVKPIPEGSNAVIPGYNVAGAARFIDFIVQAFGAEEIGGRMQTPDGKIMHSALKICGQDVMVTDAMMDGPTVSATMLYVADCDAVYKKALEAGATSINAPENMFWGDRFCRVRDAWGNRWGIGTHIEDVAPDEMERRARAEAEKFAEMMKQQKK